MEDQQAAAIEILSPNSLARLDEHLVDEEITALPIIEEHLTDDEWQATLNRGAEFLSARNLQLGIVMLGMVLGVATDDQGRVFISNLPLPQRWLAKMFGPRSAAAYRRRLDGLAARR
jgi:hypothetical protein